MLSPGDQSIHFVFTPDDAGTLEGTVGLESSNGQRLSISVQGIGLAIPPCSEAPVCAQIRFNPDAGVCQSTLEPDGTPCETHSLCLQDAVCHAGRCEGTSVSCDDGNACTVDACNPIDGCVHLPSPPCPSAGPCQVATCDAVHGCVSQQAADGTLCDPEPTCQSAQVCISGQCQARTPPDGFVCREASPCQAEARCSSGECVGPPAGALEPDWSFDATDAGVNLHDFVLDPSGEVSLFGFFQPMVFSASSAAPIVGASLARRCISWIGRIACADSPVVQGTVSLYNLTNDSPQWTFDLLRARPDFTSSASNVFMARLVALSDERLGALFEAWPASPSDAPRSPTLCRRYFWVELDPGGGLISAGEIHDAALERCVHPHPFGVVADVAGRPYVGFSPTDPPTSYVPLLSSPDLTVLALNDDGTTRWRQTVDLPGGELAAANGLIVAETGATFSAESGALLDLPKFGRAVSTDALAVLAPDAGERALIALNPLDGGTAWTAVATGVFASDELRLASWRTGNAFPPAEVVLALDAADGGIQLEAFRTTNGHVAWACPLDGWTRAIPSTFEVSSATLATMGGAGGCGHCDPPYALSAGEFHRFALPGVETVTEPWIGTMGGPGHPHREQAATVTSSATRNPARRALQPQPR